MQLLLFSLHLNQKGQISWLNRKYSSMINLTLWQSTVYKTYNVWKCLPKEGLKPSAPCCAVCWNKEFIDYSSGKLKHVEESCSRRSVEGQGLTDGGALHRLLNFYFLFVLWNNQETISYYLSQELLWRIPKMFLLKHIFLLPFIIESRNSMICKSASIWTHCIS